jgi:SAM-dependent methyltransferase
MTQHDELEARFAAAGGGRSVFSRKALDYARGRPAYPAALFEHIERHLGAGESLRIADVGAGTGLLTQGWLERGHAAFAVEPNDEMRAAADKLLGRDPRYRSVAAPAEATTLTAAAFDLVTAAQSFHWFEPVAFRRECLRILRTAGQVALIWNDRASDSAVQTALDSVFEEFGGIQRTAQAVRQSQQQGVQAFFGAGAFGTWRFDHAQQLDREGLRGMVFSRSYMPAADSPAGLAAARKIDALFNAFATNDVLSLPYRCVLFLGRPG